jgi:hypothetical protein
LVMTFRRLEDMFEGYFADTFADKFPLMSMGDKQHCQVWSEPYENPFWEKSYSAQREKEKNAVNSGHLVP